ncbi:hypothetical protein MMC08_006056 [Hypocenomyce scalaris]|nr:hypothetical protein [Hypocenomyce scalaris]
MERTGPWPPACVGVALFITSAISMVFVPETLKVKQTQEPEQQEPSDQKSRLSHLVDRFKESLSILQSPSLIVLMVACLGSLPIFFATSSFMAQFISKRYKIKFFQGGYVQSAFGVAQMVQLLIILPWLSKSLMHSTTPPRFRSTDEHHRDLSMARWSYGITVVAALVLGLAPTLSGFVFGLVLLALGSCCVSLTRSLMSLYVDPVHRSRLFGLVGMIEVVGSIYAQPMLAGLFSLGMKLGGGWIGLPYYGLMLLVAVTTALLLFVKVPKKAEYLPPAPENTNHED